MSKVTHINCNGLGISNDWAMNALLEAKPKNLLNLANNYKLLKIKPDNKLSESELLISLFSGVNYLGAENLLANYFKDGSVYNSQSFRNFLGKIQKHNAKINLIGLSSNLKILKLFLNQIKKSGYFRIFIHLIDDTDLTGSNYSDLLSEVETLGAKVATISSIDSLYSEKTIFDTTNNIISGFMKAKRFSGFGRKPITRTLIFEKCEFIESFDGILFFDPNVENILPLIENMASGKYSFSEFVPFLTVFPVQSSAKFQSIFDFSPLPAMAEISKSKKTLIITESTQSKLYNKILGNKNFSGRIFYVAASEDSSYLGQRSSLLLKIQSLYARYYNEYDYIFIDLPIISKTAKVGSFNHCVESVRLFDSFIEKILTMMDHDNTLLISSLYGLAEKFNYAENPPMPRTLKWSNNLLPYIVVKGFGTIKTQETLKFPASSSGLLSADGETPLIIEKVKEYLEIS